jgi:hypothetical protein
VLVECGFVRATTGDGREWTFAPTFRRIAEIGSPHDIVATFAALHDPAKAAPAARLVLACLCEQDDPTPLIGGEQIDLADPATPAVPIAPLMPEAEQIIIARHLMQHGICGTARPEKTGAQGGKYSDRFDVAEYVAAARAHLGMSREDAEGLSMTELQQMLRMKFPEAHKPERDVPSREEYAAAMRRVTERTAKGAGRG